MARLTGGEEEPLIPIVCVDDRGGVLFNRRRQSQDALLRADALAAAAGSRLWMSAYTRSQFREDTGTALIVDENFLEKAGPGDYCFVEGAALTPHLDRVEAVVLYRWNRCYPFDTSLDLALDRPPWRLASSEEFAGSSHERITKEVYRR